LISLIEHHINYRVDQNPYLLEQIVLEFCTGEHK